MLSKPYRLKKNADIQELRRTGRSWSNKHLVLIVQENKVHKSRFAFSVSRRVGKAVTRNRIKRLMRESVRRSLPNLQAGRDVLFIARQPARTASFAQIDHAVTALLQRSRLSIGPTQQSAKTDQPESEQPRRPKAVLQ
jgi:ribonuclease P protein component